MILYVYDRHVCDYYNTKGSNIVLSYFLVTLLHMYMLNMVLSSTPLPWIHTYGLNMVLSEPIVL